MSDGTKIEWTDATWNPITGCSVVSPGCTNCYAMRLAGTRLAHHSSRAGLTRDTKGGPVWTGEVRFNKQWLDQPLRWKKPRMIFVCAHGDLFAEGVPDEWIDKVFAVMALAPWHTFQVLTKRPKRMRAYFAETYQVAAQPAQTFMDVTVPAQPARIEDRWHQINHAIDDVTLDNKLFNQNRFWTKDGKLIGRPAWPHRPLPNVWLGVSVEDQCRADERIPILLDTPAAVRWISAEPLLGPVNMAWALSHHRLDIAGGFIERGMFSPGLETLRRLDWVVAGGESGPGARPMHPDWARSLRDQCAATGVPFLFKQWGAWAHMPERAHFKESFNDPWRRVGSDKEGGRPALMFDVGKSQAGRLLDGIEHNGFPERIGA